MQEPPLAEAPPARATPVVVYGPGLDPALRTRLEAQLPAAPPTGDDFPDMRALLSPDAAFAFYDGRRAVEMGAPERYHEYLAEIQRRDAADSGREIAPLRQAEGSLVLDTGALDVEECVAAIVARLEESGADA